MTSICKTIASIIIPITNSLAKNHRMGISQILANPAFVLPTEERTPTPKWTKLYTPQKCANIRMETVIMKNAIFVIITGSFIITRTHLKLYSVKIPTIASFSFVRSCITQIIS